jgi:hypothetical protein
VVLELHLAVQAVTPHFLPLHQMVVVEVVLQEETVLAAVQVGAVES